MIKWYFKDGTLAADMSEDGWEGDMYKLNELLGDMEYKRVAQTTLPDGKWVSTVWLGLDYGYPISDEDQTNWKPVIFETMVFSSKGGSGDIDMDRYSTEEEAIKGHKAMVRKWKRKIKASEQKEDSE